MGCSNCSDNKSCGCGCSSGCGEPVKIISKQGLKGDKGDTGDQGIQGAPGDPASFYFEINQSIDFLDSYTFGTNINSTSIGSISILASANGQNKSYHVGTPVKIKPLSQLSNPGSFLQPVPEISGFVSSYDINTGALGINVQSIQGIGTFTEWAVDLNYSNPNRISHIRGIDQAPSGAGSSTGSITIPANTIFKQFQTVKINIVGETNSGSGDGIIYFDGVELFRKAFLGGEKFNLDITINAGFYVTIFAELRTDVGTDNHIQTLGINDVNYLFTTYAPNFKTDLELTFEQYLSQPFIIYSGVAYRI